MGLFKWQSPKRKGERRRYPRINHSLRINYQIGNDTLHSDCNTKDISEVGIRLYLYQRLATETTLKLYIYFLNDMEPVLLLGKVIWIRETLGGDFPFEAGIEFDFLDASARSKIQSYIQNISQK